MLQKTGRVLIGAGVVFGALVALQATGGTAGARSSSGAVQPQQTFFGLVNGSSIDAKVEVACSEAVRPGETGPPVSGQTIAVRSPSPSTVPSGSTGSLGRKIVARFVTTSAAASSTVTFTHYGSEPLPTTLALPCLGSGTIVFSPKPTSATGRSETMTVMFVTPCPGVCADKVHVR
jgi:hypothetical protein